MSKWIDTEQFLRTIVVDRRIANDDGFLHWYCGGNGYCNNHNYYWYVDPIVNNLQLIPWDLDNAFENLVTNCAKLGISIIEIPLVDSSSLKTNNGKIQFKNNLEKIFPLIEHLDIDIVLETDLPPNDFRDFLLEINHPQVFANFDSGNSASLGYLPNEELKILKKWIKNIHIKDSSITGRYICKSTRVIIDLSYSCSSYFCSIVTICCSTYNI